MDFPCKFQTLLLILLHFQLLNSMIRASVKSSKIYNLTQSCTSVNENSDRFTQTKLTINHFTGALIKSHSGYALNSVDNDNNSNNNEGYPDNFFCEIVAQASTGHLIMLSIESFYIPSQNSVCDENYLYVFDYRSSRSKAMTSAGGEKGLCGRTFPKYPIFTTGPFITIVFKSNLRDFIAPTDAGFQLTLTQVQQDKNNACKSGHFQCSSINLSATSNEEDTVTINGAAALRKPDESVKKKNDSPVTMARQIIPSRSITPTIFYYCIPFDLICDGVKNCHDGSDEDSNAKKLCMDVTNKSIINRFLSLGLSASIAIAVSCTIAVTLCIGISVCYCIKLCTSRFDLQQPQFTKGVSTGSDYQPSNNYPSNLPVNNMDTYCSSYMPSQSSQFVCIKDVSSPSSSNEPDKIYCVYQDPQFHGYANMSALARPASEKICHWTSSSLASYPSTSEGHHSHPETPYFKRETTFGDQSPHRNDSKCRSSNSRGHTSSYSHHTPTSSRSAKSTRSTKSSHVEKKPLKKNNSTQKNHKQFEKFRKYPTDSNRIIVLGPVLGEV